MKKLAITLIVLAAYFYSPAAGKQYVYTQISQKEGLTSTVNSIYKEKDGIIWIGTPNGLYSFNGYTLKGYGNKLHDSRRIRHVSRDSHGDLWVLTEKHILRQTSDAENFEVISQKTREYGCLSGDIDGLWIGGGNEIYRYSFQTRTLCQFCLLPENFICNTIKRLDSTTLLCCSHNGKKLVDTESGEITEAPFGSIKEVSSALVDRNGNVWIAYYNKGIEVYDRSGTVLKSFNTGNSLLSCDLVLCLEEKDSKVIAGTDGGGINMIDMKTGQITILSHISGDPSSFPAHSIKSLYTDYYGTIWAGSVRDGLISISQSEINSYGDTYLGLNNGLSNPTVLYIHQSSGSDIIWIGTDGEGINSFNPKNSKFTHYESTFKTKVVSIADYSDTELAISTYADNLWIFDKVTGKVRALPITNPDIKYWIRHSGRSVNLYNEKDGSLLLYANVVYRYDKSTGNCTPVSLDTGETSYSNMFILGCSDEGIWLHNYKNIFLLEEDSEILVSRGTHEHGMIRSGHLDPDGYIWLATEEGLCRFNTANNSFEHIYTTLFSDATSIICDKRSRVWIGTENGLSAYLSESGSFALLGESDGVVPNEFLPKPRLLAENGDVYFGGVQGLLKIGSDYTIETTEIPVLTLESLMLDDEKVFLKEDGSIQISRSSKTMNININVIEKDMFRNRVFRFEVSGKTHQTHIPSLTLQQMPGPGRHEIKVSCTKRNGEWTEPVNLAFVNVPYPWYLSWWFLTGCTALIVIIYTLSILTVNRRKSNQLKLAIKEQEQKIYEEKVSMLINISHELRTPLTLIMAPLKRLLKMMDTEDSSYQVLSRIYRQSRRMRSLLDMVLDLRKMEAGGNRLHIEKSDFNSWISGAVDDIVNEEKAEGIGIVYDFDPSVNIVEFDMQKCDIVLTNILINAIKHSTSGDVITIKTECVANESVRISISDQGPGLGKDIDPEKMFTRFYQSKNEKYGSGIGLSYSKILVQMHGGNIGVYNNEDKGATFWWEIPVSAIEETENESRAYLNELLGHSSEAEIASPSEETFDTSGMKLMLVDDNQDLLDFLREALCDDFAEIVTVTGGKAALQEISSAGKLPDIIVSDVNMPEGNGFWLCNELKNSEKYSHIPFVLLTARGEDQSQSESYRLGADGFLAKPFEIETLMELVRSLLRNKAEIRKRYLDNEETSDTDYGSNEEKFIIQLNKIISENISNSALDQQLICRELGVSRALLYNKMKAITGAGAKEYITRIRIEKAKSLIETTSLTIAEISDMAGFASQSYFSTAFKNYEGMTPSAYKSAKRNSAQL